MPDQQIIQFIVGALIKIVIIFTLLQVLLILMVWAERRLLAVIQMRLGPNRVGPFGLLQSLADGLKFIFKEDIIPLHVNRWLYIMAPAVGLVTAFMAMIVYPFGDKVPIPFAATINAAGRSLLGVDLNLSTMSLYVTNFNVGLLYVLAITGIGVYGIVLAGWASNSKYSLLGGLRSSAQLVSYELALGLSLIPVMLMNSSLDLVKITNQQAGYFFSIGGWGIIPKWNIFYWLPVGAIAFLTYLISAIAETNRVPFDLPEAETELVAGFHTEYSALKFAMFFMAEYTNMTTVSVLATVMFLGGWNGPFVQDIPLLGPFYFVAKVFFFLFLYIWLRGTLPRFRYDQLMNFGWKFLMPVALLNIILAAVAGLFFA
ncbi:MAG TPA: NADH-quinone oxidoreductase subunit NuoH [Blastocatellia bacterium]|nr:NADH-quinone oxidoreductase subunit NuoH [Blastocatellia bacterium]